MSEWHRELVRGREFFRIGDFAKAEEHLIAVTNARPDFADVFNMLGLIYQTSNRSAQAIAAFEKALLLNPNYSEAALNLCVAYSESGHFDKAKIAYEAATRTQRRRPGTLDPSASGRLANMHADLGEAYATLSHYDDAVREYTRALELGPDYVDVRCALASVHRDHGHHERALHELELACALRPQFAVAHLQRGIVLNALGRRDEAREAWEYAQRLEPQNKQAALYLRMA